MNIDAGAITLVQTVFMQHMSATFALVTHYAFNLLYIFASLEIVFFGLGWALQSSAAWERLFFKLIKLGLIFFIVQNYAYLTDSLIRSVAQVGGLIANVKHLDNIVFNPALIWQHGYDIGVALLKRASISSGFGLPFLEILLGMGILLVFGLLGIQIVIQLVGFYLIALIGLVLLPFGAFDQSIGMFDQSIRSVLKAGIRVMVLVIVIGVAVTVWNTFDPIDVQGSFNLNQVLGLFFTSLLLLYLAIRLPTFAADAVGHVIKQWGGESAGVGAGVTTSVMAPSTLGVSEGTAMQAATAIDQRVGASMSPSVSSVASATSLWSSAASVSTSPSVAQLSQMTMYRDRDREQSLDEAIAVKQSISNTTLKQIKEKLDKVLQPRVKGK
ncbi:MAG: type IV secretion system protein [Gammaproteobacteria bacterium]|nr:type IV secretion system protein [Gammaproteobacteria bacterium]